MRNSCTLDWYPRLQRDQLIAHHTLQIGVYVSTINSIGIKLKCHDMFTREHVIILRNNFESVVNHKKFLGLHFIQRL